ncbi:pyruvate dehydrogenase (acetyl-transferring) E1 component subunit alpha [Aerococcus sp. HMSC072A12]|nr:pyruvate dehydrogenase (acetyl-transferring) E1 component subunit alpha [Aerococcus sp. HMSC072A12]OFR36309.1 pyruvate dehydrogenase (acetyl-transferring) E1 component subunit alpha [Aerococcus sp. HMSC061A03]
MNQLEIGKKSILNLDQLQVIAEQFPLLQAIDKDGEVVNAELLSDLTDDQLLELMRRMVFARAFDEQTNSYSQQGRMGFYAPSKGQEAAMIASHFAFAKEDFLFGSYRDMPQLLMHGASVADIYNWSKGHVNGSTFIYDKGIQAALPQIIIGAQLVQAQGNALGQKLNASPQVTFTYIGDGGTSQGDSYEAMNFAGVYQSPLIIFIQNNGYAISTPLDQQTQAQTLAQKAVAAGIPGVRVDGNDALATYCVAKEARNYAASGNGPVVVELVTNRMEPHSTMGDDPMRYRDQASLDYWQARDPLSRYGQYLSQKGLYSKETEEKFYEDALETIKQGMAESEATEPMRLEDSFAWQYPQSN